MDNDSNATPQWQPPAELSDPFVLREAAERPAWMRVSRGRIPGFANQAVALRLADYGSSKGKSCHPGATRLARDTCSSDKSVRRALAWLVESGWINLVSHGNRRIGHADTYELSIPAPVLVDMGEWTGDPSFQWRERADDDPSGSGVTADVRPQVSVPEHRTTVAERESGVKSKPKGVKKSPKLDVGDPPPGEHPVLYAPSRDSITASHTSVRRSERPPFDPDAVDYDEKLIDYINDRLGGTMHSMTEQLVLSMIANGANWKMIVHTAVARDHLFAS